MITQEDGTISVYSLFSTASSNKKIHQLQSSGEIQKMYIIWKIIVLTILGLNGEHQMHLDVQRMIWQL